MDLSSQFVQGEKKKKGENESRLSTKTKRPKRFVQQEIRKSISAPINLFVCKTAPNQANIGSNTKYNSTGHKYDVSH